MKRAPALLLTLAACGTKATTTPVDPKPTASSESPLPSGPVALDEAGEGRTVDVKAGTELTITLKSNPTTGYDWYVVEAPAALGTPDSKYVRPDEMAVGSGGRRRFTWMLPALPPGEHPIVLAYRRDFEGTKPPLRTYRVVLRHR